MDEGLNFGARGFTLPRKTSNTSTNSLSLQSDNSSIDSYDLDYALKTLKKASVMSLMPTGGSGPLDLDALGEDSDSERSLHSRSYSPEGVGSFELTGSVEMQNKKLHRKVHTLEKQLGLLQRKLESQPTRKIFSPGDPSFNDQYMAEMSEQLFQLAEDLESRRKLQVDKQYKLELEIMELESQKQKIQVEWSTLKDTSMMIEFRKKQYDRKLKKFKEAIVESRKSMDDSKKEIEKYVKSQWFRLKKTLTQKSKELEEILVNKIKAKREEARQETLHERERLSAEFDVKKKSLMQELERRENQVEEHARRNHEARKRMEKMKDDLKAYKTTVEEERRMLRSEKRELEQMRTAISESKRQEPPVDVLRVINGCKMEMENVKQSMGKFQSEMIERFVQYFSTTIEGLDQKVQNVDRINKEIQQSFQIAQFAGMNLECENGEGGESAIDYMEGFEVRKEKERLMKERAIFEKEKSEFLQVQQFFESDQNLGTLAQRISRYKADKHHLENEQQKLKMQTMEFENILLEKQQQFEQAQANWHRKLERERATINRLKKELKRHTSSRSGKIDYRQYQKQTSI